MTKMVNFTLEQVDKEIKHILQQDSAYFKTERDAMLFALSILDLTTLEGKDTNADIRSLCSKATSFEKLNLPNVAAVCVYPVFVKQAKSLLKDTDINIASVAGAFPSGQSPLHIKLAEIQYAIDEGADEIDMVISRGKFIQGEYDEVYNEIREIRNVCNDAHLKVILETGELPDLNAIYKASEIAINAGADFIKTSTGKISPAATVEASFIMLQAIKEHFQKTGKMIGFKPAGGISTPEQAYTYIKLVESILGVEWLTKDLFRIGASRLATNLAEVLK